EQISADFQVVPFPQNITQLPDEKNFVLNPDTRIVAADSAMADNAAMLAGYIASLNGFTPEITGETPADNYIVLSADLDHENSEAYEINVSPERIAVNGASPAGTFYGIQTLRKSMSAPAGDHDVVFSPAIVSDAPRFSYRGAHFDSSRHFFDADSMKIFIDMLALHNINRMHWHLTDDQGWRIEIKSRPELTAKGSVRNGTLIGAATEDNHNYNSTPYGGYYTQQQIRDIVDYAARRHITIIPEIDLPGHMQAALAAYPELGCTGGPYEVWQRWGISDDVLCAGNDSVYTFINDVLREVTELFPSEYIHIGGDECPKVRWEKCPRCQARIRQLGLRDNAHGTAEQQLQSHVMRHATEFLTGLGRKVIGWDEILEGGIAPGAVVMSWRGTEGGIAAAEAGHDAIMTPSEFLYFDFVQSHDKESEPQAATWGEPVTVERVYNYNPIPENLTPEQAARIIGVQANLWTEYIPTMRHAQYMELPRLGALAEIQWSGAEKDYPAFLQRLIRLTRIYDAEGYNYARHILENSHEAAEKLQ
ncbi:MAG: beta-N-acetylhexosaminidase, partial [Muribaculaceae bacterium]|nr:beta-N-acetylhexosaminidase [Muribaculaceae bacterium]